MIKLTGTPLHAFILGVFCAGYGLWLAATDGITKAPIAQRLIEDKQASLAAVLPPSIYDNNPVTQAYILQSAGKDLTIYPATKAGKVTGVAYEIVGSGYGGPIKLMLGVDPEGKILGVRAITHKETPGLGDKIQPNKSNWILNFTGLSLGSPPKDKWKVKKDGGQFDQFSGATITPRGVVTGIRNGLEFFAANKSKLMEKR